MARELIRWATPEQVAAAPSRLLCGAAYAHDLPMLTELLQKGLQPGDQAAPLLRPLLAAYDTQAQEILDRLAEQQAQVNSAPEQNGPVLGGMSL